jgi:hypothetical protein
VAAAAAETTVGRWALYLMMLLPPLWQPAQLLVNTAWTSRACAGPGDPTATTAAAAKPTQAAAAEPTPPAGAATAAAGTRPWRSCWRIVVRADTPHSLATARGAAPARNWVVEAMRDAGAVPHAAIPLAAKVSAYNKDCCCYSKHPEKNHAEVPH